MTRPLTFSRRRRDLFGAALAGVALSPFSGAALAQSNYPSKPIRFIVPYPPGGGTDIVARMLAVKMSQSMGQQVIVENKPGGSTIIGTTLLAQADPDGHTLGLITDSHAINPNFFEKLPYDSIKDFEMVSQLVAVPLMMVAHPKLGVKTVQEFIAKAKSQPGKINYASIGNGTPHQLAMEWFKSLADVKLTHVPYKGVAPALAALVGGEVDVMFTGTSSAKPYVDAKRLVPLAVSSAKRQPAFPDVPSVAETLPKYDFMTWYGSALPGGTPPEIVARLSREIAAALNQPDVKARLATLGVLGSPSTPKEFAEFMRKETEALARMVRITGVKVN